MAKPVVLGNGREWKAQSHAKAHFRTILHAHGNGDVITDPAHHDDLAALLERYDNAITGEPSKIGSGIDRFERRVNAQDGFSTPGFWVVRTDGTATDFSFYAAVEGRPKPRSAEFADACRAAIAKDMSAAKRRHFADHGDGDGRVLCDISDQPISIDEAHLDHAYPTFGAIVVMFRAARGWHDEVPPGVLTPSQDAQTTTTFIDSNVGAAFREFHRRGARLRVISARSNLAMAAGQRAPKIKRPVTV
jgi:hypothetical protein